MDNNVKTIDIASLPVAKSVSKEDTLLLMRQGESGKNELMQVGKGTLTGGLAKKKRVKRYVIGRAITPGSVHDTGHENWYCYGYGSGYGSGSDSGYGSGSGSGSGYGLSMRLPIRADAELLRHVFIDDKEYTYTDNAWPSPTEPEFSIHSWGEGITLRLYVEQNNENGNLYGQAFCVVKYEGDRKAPTSIWLKKKALPYLATIRSDSTHHSIEAGKHVWKSNAYMGEIWVGDGSIEDGNLGILKRGQNVNILFVPTVDWNGKKTKTMLLRVELFAKNNPCKVFALKNEVVRRGDPRYRRGYTSLKKEHYGLYIRVRKGTRVKRYDIRLLKMEGGTKRKGEMLHVVLHGYTYINDRGEEMLSLKWK